MQLQFPCHSWRCFRQCLEVVVFGLDKNDDLVDGSCCCRCDGKSWNGFGREPLDQGFETIVCRMDFGLVWYAFFWFGSNWIQSDEDRNCFREKISLEEI